MSTNLVLVYYYIFMNKEPPFIPLLPVLSSVSNMIYVVMKSDNDKSDIDGGTYDKPIRAYVNKTKAECSLKQGEFIVGPITLDGESSKSSYPDFPFIDPLPKPKMYGSKPPSGIKPYPDLPDPFNLPTSKSLGNLDKL